MCDVFPQSVSMPGLLNWVARSVSWSWGKNWEAANTQANSQLEKITEAQVMIGGNAEAQALGIPKVMTALVSGQGSGVRITQAELNAVAHARGISGDFEGTLRKWSGKGQLTKQQQAELNLILEDVKSKIVQKQQIANDTLDKVNYGRTREEMIAADQEGRRRLADMERNAGGSGNYTVGGVPYNIPAEHVQEFLRDHPNANPVGRQ